MNRPKSPSYRCLLGTQSSPFVWKVRTFAALKSLPIPLVVDRPSLPGSRVPDLNPLGKIPVLILDDDTALYDSRVIEAFIEALQPDPALIPTVPGAHIEVLRLEALADGLTDAAVLIVNELRRPANERSAAWISKQRAKIERSISAFSKVLRENGSLIGDSISVADIALHMALLFLDTQFPRFEWRAEYPGLAAAQDARAILPAFSGRLEATLPPGGIDA